VSAFYRVHGPLAKSLGEGPDALRQLLSRNARESRGVLPVAACAEEDAVRGIPHEVVEPAASKFLLLQGVVRMPDP
jgi:hypothetical protein